MNQIIVDTGPIVAILSASDSYHQVCLETLKIITPPMLTTWAVLTEVQYLLRKDNRALQALLTGFNNNLFVLEDISADALPWLQKFLLKYDNLRPQLADASLMYLAEKRKIETIFTLDRRDFSIYRFQNKKAPNILPSL